jgi:hypothetical protein
MALKSRSAGSECQFWPMPLMPLRPVLLADPAATRAEKAFDRFVKKA